MPTTRPRYTITDTGEVRDLLDDAERRWPNISDRKQLLLRLAQTGHRSLHLGEEEIETRRRQARQRTALESLGRMVAWDAIRDDQAWR